MKLPALIFSLAIIASVYPDLQADSNLHTELYSLDSQDSKELIEKEDLPPIVLQEFNKSIYKQWTIEKVYMVKGSDKVTYELHLTQLGESMVLIADAKGQLQPKAEI